jgi:hypothetical protein
VGCKRLEIGPNAEHARRATLVAIDEDTGQLITAPAAADIDMSEVPALTLAACRAQGLARCRIADACFFAGYRSVAVGKKTMLRVGVGCGFQTPALANQAAIAKCGSPLGLLASDCAVGTTWEQ